MDQSQGCRGRRSCRCRDVNGRRRVHPSLIGDCRLDRLGQRHDNDDLDDYALPERRRVQISEDRGGADIEHEPEHSGRDGIGLDQETQYDEHHPQSHSAAHDQLD